MCTKQRTSVPPNILSFVNIKTCTIALGIYKSCNAHLPVPISHEDIRISAEHRLRDTRESIRRFGRWQEEKCSVGGMFVPITNPRGHSSPTRMSKRSSECTGIGHKDVGSRRCCPMAWNVTLVTGVA